MLFIIVDEESRFRIRFFMQFLWAALFATRLVPTQALSRDRAIPTGHNSSFKAAGTLLAELVDF